MKRKESEVENIINELDNLTFKRKRIKNDLDYDLDSIKEYSECSIIAIELGMCSKELLDDSYDRYSNYPKLKKNINLLIGEFLNIYEKLFDEKSDKKINKNKIEDDKKELYKLIYKIDKFILEFIEQS